MKYLFFLIILTSCLPLKSKELEVGSCVLGENMVTWKLLRKDNAKYVFVDSPVKEGSLMRSIEDISGFKKVDCPN